MLIKWGNQRWAKSLMILRHEQLITRSILYMNNFFVLLCQWPTENLTGEKKYWCLDNFSWWKACPANRFLKILGKTSCSEFYFSYTVRFHSGICLRKKNNWFTCLNREIYLNAFLILSRMRGKRGEVSRTFKWVMIILNKSMLVLTNFIKTNLCNLLIFRLW